MTIQKLCVVVTVAWWLVGAQRLFAAMPKDQCAQCVCKGEKEAFELFKAGAGEFDSKYLPPSDINSVSYVTSDGTTLSGYMAKARDQKNTLLKAQGYILLLPGNAVYAQRLVSIIRELSRLGYDVYIYDYRGYRPSDAPPDVKTIIADTSELVTELNRSVLDGALRYKSHVVYGISAGGAIALNALDASSKIDRFILDGLPATMSMKVDVPFLFRWLIHPVDLKCPEALDPLNRKLFAPKQTLLINGAQDEVLRHTQDKRLQGLLLERAKVAGVCVSSQPAFHHPLMDNFTSKRIEIIERFLRTDLSKGCPTLPVY